MEVALLGPVRAGVDGAPVALGGSANCALLAVLALAAPRALTVTELIDALWVDEPASASGVLQNRVFRLRRAFLDAGADGEVIATAGRGYRFAAPASTVDVHRVMELDARARAAADRGEHRSACALWRDALALWTGEPLAGLDEAPFVVTESSRLRDLRWDIAERRFALELLRGGSTDIVGELQQAVAAAPLREGLSRQLMTALYRAGRRADALAEFAALRKRLRAELGLDPDPESVRVQAAILAEDAALLGAEEHPVRVSMPATLAPHPLPRTRTRFVGRQRDVIEVTKLLSTTGCVTVCGPGGVGKTRLVLEAAALAAEAYPDGVIFAELAATSDAAAVAEVVCTAAGVPRGDHPARTAREALAAALQDRQVLLILDNCEHVIDATADLAAELLSGRGGLHVLATSREPLRIDGEVIWRLAPLAVPDPADALDLESCAAIAGVRLFLDRALLCRPDFVFAAEDVAPVAQIVRMVDGLPLALELAAAALDRLELPELAAALADRLGTLAENRRGTHARLQTLRSTIDWSYQLLDQREREILERVGLLAGDADLDTVAAVTSDLTDDVEPVLRVLVDRSLVTRRAGRVPCYLMLDTIRAFARERLAERHPDGSGCRPLWEWAQAAARAVDAAEAHGDLATFERLDDLMPNVRAALRTALEHHQAAVATEIAVALKPYWQLRALDAEAVGWFAELLALGEDTVAEPDVAQQRARALLAAAELTSDGPDAQALFHRAIALSERIGDSRTRGRALSALGDHHTWKVPDRAAAEAALREARELLEAAGDSVGVAVALERLAAIDQREQANLAAALELLREAMQVLPADGYPVTRFWMAVAIGFNLAYQGDVAGSRCEFAQALAIAEAAHFDTGELYALAAMAQNDLALGDVAAASERTTRMRTLRDRTGNAAWDGWQLTIEARVALAEGRVDAAVTIMQDRRARGNDGHRSDFARRVSVLAGVVGLYEDAAELLAHVDAAASPAIGDARLSADVDWLRRLAELPASDPSVVEGDLTKHALTVLDRVARQPMIVALPPCG